MPRPARKLRDETLRQVALWRLEGFTSEEIADHLQCSVRSVARKLELIRRTWLSETERPSSRRSRSPIRRRSPWTYWTGSTASVIGSRRPGRRESGRGSKITWTRLPIPTGVLAGSRSPGRRDQLRGAGAGSTPTLADISGPAARADATGRRSPSRPPSWSDCGDRHERTGELPGGLAHQPRPLPGTTGRIPDRPRAGPRRHGGRLPGLRPEARAVVALKTVRRADPAAILRFKQEFRALADVTHPNLVTLYELVSDGRQLVLHDGARRGVDFLTYVRRASTCRTPTTAEDRGCRSVPPATTAGYESAATPEPARRATRRGRARDRAGLLPGRRPSSAGCGGAAAARRGARGAARRGQAPPRHQAVQRAGDAARAGSCSSTSAWPPSWAAAGLHQSTERRTSSAPSPTWPPSRRPARPSRRPATGTASGSMLYEALTGRLPFVGRPMRGARWTSSGSSRRRPRELVARRPRRPRTPSASTCSAATRGAAHGPRGAPPAGQSPTGGRGRPPSRPSPPSGPRRWSAASGTCEALAEAFAAMSRGRTVLPVRPRPVGVGQERAGPALPRRPGSTHDEARGPGGPLLRAGVGAVQGARQPDRRAEPVPAAPAAAEAQALLPRDVRPLARVFPVLCGEVRGRGRRTPPRPPRSPTRRSCGGGPSRRCASCWPGWATAGRWSWPSTTCSGATPTAPALLAELLRPPDPPRAPAAGAATGARTPRRARSCGRFARRAGGGEAGARPPRAGRRGR